MWFFIFVDFWIKFSSNGDPCLITIKLAKFYRSVFPVYIMTYMHKKYENNLKLIFYSFPKDATKFTICWNKRSIYAMVLFTAIHHSNQKGNAQEIFLDLFVFIKIPFFIEMLVYWLKISCNLKHWEINFFLI